MSFVRVTGLRPCMACKPAQGRKHKEFAHKLAARFTVGHRLVARLFERHSTVGIKGACSRRYDALSDAVRSVETVSACTAPGGDASLSQAGAWDASHQYNPNHDRGAAGCPE